MCVSIQFDKSSKKPLYVQLYEAIKEKILSGEYSYMKKLPPVRKLCKELKVNLSTVTKALNQLQIEGYIKAVPGSGYYVVYNEYQDKVIFEEEILLSSSVETINLASSKLPYSLYPIEEFKSSINAAIDSFGPQIFDYVEPFKNPLKEYLVEDYLKKFKIYTNSSNVIIVSGAQQGIEIVAKSFLKPGDTIFMENPSYLGAYHIFNNMHLNIIGIDIDQMDQIEDYVKKFSPKALYIIPFSQNPTGISYTEEYKKYLCEIAEKYNFYIIEDDFLSDIATEEESFPIKAYDKQDRVFYIKSFSTITMPALRIGFVVAPLEFSDEVAYFKSTADISTSLFIQVCFAYFLKNHFDLYIQKLKSYIQEKRKLFLDLIKEYNLSKRLFTQNPKGIFVSFLLPPKTSSAYIYNKLKAEKVLIQPHTCFYHKPNSINFFRVSFLDCNSLELKTGIEKIRDVLNSILQKEGE
ncbi:aminotransferase-like domain-containing protein [Caldicellulosiruptor naganoensis]|uniref:PLP-dependent aminotransferase family protein n=1 Tax=Caldicellulosiruptor naganoensis TaxID=29324 RepID=A0ABY7BJM8_9FIRM|nr:PLP-dependent aminotransferase family protein [Caldicellulosiruptor naganoensis]WAM32276.1 PLP-dependent aminotransferase family protein [Caldicellulosiruptor naganoensis]